MNTCSKIAMSIFFLKKHILQMCSEEKKVHCASRETIERLIVQKQPVMDRLLMRCYMLLLAIGRTAYCPYKPAVKSRKRNEFPFLATL